MQLNEAYSLAASQANVNIRQICEMLDAAFEEIKSIKLELALQIERVNKLNANSTDFNADEHMSIPT